MAAERLLCQFSGFYGWNWSHFPFKCLAAMPSSYYYGKKNGIRVVSPKIMSPSSTAPLELLEASEDEYNGVVIDSESLPSSSANAFAAALRSSLLNWKLKGGFSYHHAEPGYVMLTYWIPEGPCLLPASPSHQIGIAAFVINANRQILVVKEKCSSSCSGVWKLPTGYINKSEELFSGAIREVKEETGVDTMFLEMVAFRHVHLVSFEKSDLLFVCMLKPLSFDIVIDENEIQDAKWISVEEVLGQQFYEEDEMLRKIIEICMDTYDNRYRGFTAQQLISKFDGKLSYLYYKNPNLILLRRD